MLNAWAWISGGKLKLELRVLELRGRFLTGAALIGLGDGRQDTCGTWGDAGDEEDEG
jgi:hypothetical protein